MELFRDVRLNRLSPTWRRATLEVVLTLAAAIATCVPASAQAQLASVDGIVTTQRGTIPLGGAQVVVRDATDHEVAAVLSEGDGRFHITDLQPGKHTIIVTLDGFDAGRTTVSVAPSGTASVTFDLPIATITTTIDVVAPPQSVVSAGDTIAAADDIGSKDTDRLAPGGGLQAALRLLASVIEVP